MNATRKIRLFLTVALLCVAGCKKETDAAGAPADTESVEVFKIKLGDCLVDPDPDAISADAMDKIACGKPHGYEVYHVFSLPKGDYPGEKMAETLANAGCLQAFEPFVGKNYDDSTLDYHWLEPSIESWRERDDREVVCLLLNQDESPRTGSAKGIGI